jgi:cytochrome c oxidase subunit 2
MGLEERTHPQTGSSGSLPDRPHARADWRQMVGIGLVAAALGIAAGLLIDWFPLDASKEAKPIDTLWDVLLIASIPIFVMVIVIVLFSVVKFRMRPGEEELDGPPIHGNTRLEVIWTTIPAILLVGLCTYAFLVLEDVEASPNNPLPVRVVGEQFAWTFYYRDPNGSNKEIAARELHLPINRPVKFTIEAKDVLHDFWVPAFA